MSNSLELPIYADKPRRKIPGTTCVAVTMYKSHDGSVAEYAIFTADGEAYLGNAHFQPKRRFQSRGFTMKSVPGIADEKWSTLAEFAIEMASRHSLDVAS